MLDVARVSSTHMRGRTRGQTTEVKLNRTGQIGKISTGDSVRKEWVVLQTTPRDQPRASSRINENYCVTKLQARLLTRSSTPPDNRLFKVKPHVVSNVHTVPGHSQKRELSPGSAGCYYKDCKLKSVRSVSCVTQLSCVQPVTNVKNVASNLPVGARLPNFLQTWLHLGAGRKIIQILRDGYTLLFRSGQISQGLPQS